MLGSCNDSPRSDCATPWLPIYSCIWGYPLLPWRRRRLRFFTDHRPLTITVSDPLIQMLRRWILKYLCLTALSIFSSNSLATNTSRKKESILLKLIPTNLSTCKFLFFEKQINGGSTVCVEISSTPFVCPRGSRYKTERGRRNLGDYYYLAAGTHHRTETRIRNYVTARYLIRFDVIAARDNPLNEQKIRSLRQINLWSSRGIFQGGRRIWLLVLSMCDIQDRWAFSTLDISSSRPLGLTWRISVFAIGVFRSLFFAILYCKQHNPVLLGLSFH